MKKRRFRLLYLLLALALIYGCGKTFYNIRESRKSSQLYDEALQIAKGHSEPAEIPAEDFAEEPSEPADIPEAPVSEPPAEEVPQEEEPEPVPIPDDPYIQELLTYDIPALQEENEDVLGWILLPDSNISFPLLQWTDNEFYLNHSWQQTPSTSGAIFIECENSPDLTDFNTIIYGHNMSMVNMFGQLHNYRRSEYLESHPHVYVMIDSGVYRYDVFATQRARTDCPIYGLGLDTDLKKTEMLRYSLDYSLINTGNVPTIENRLLTLSTCSGQGYTTRFVVQFVLNEEASYFPLEPLF